MNSKIKMGLDHRRGETLLASQMLNGSDSFHACVERAPHFEEDDAHLYGCCARDSEPVNAAASLLAATDKL